MRCNLHDADIMEEARTEAKLEAARNLIEKHLLSFEDISDCTGLPLETVQQLADEIKAKD